MNITGAAPVQNTAQDRALALYTQDDEPQWGSPANLCYNEIRFSKLELQLEISARIGGTMQNMKLGTKFTLLLSVVFVVGVLASGLVLWQVLQQQAQEQVTMRGEMLLQAMNSVRGYTSHNVRPLLEDELYTSPEFISETVPAFSARTVFENFRQDDHYSRFLYKEASANPTNLLDLADTFETELLQKLEQNPDAPQIAGFRRLDSEDVYYIAQPMVLTDESCLACHGEAAAAPENMLAKYGAENGFGWQINDVIAAQIIYVPAAEVFNTAMRSFLLVMSIFVLTFMLIIVLINYLLRRYVIEPVGTMGVLAGKISTDDVSDADIEGDDITAITGRADELGEMARLFQKMAREVLQRTRNLKNQVQELRIEIDEIKRKKQVQEVVETDFFQDLQRKAQQMRKKSGRSLDQPPEASPE